MRPPSQPLPLLPLGRFREEYHLVRVLGRGMFSTVFAVRHRQTGRELAAKAVDVRRLRATAAASGPRTDSSSGRRRRGASRSKGVPIALAREVALLARLRHPHIVRLHAAYAGWGAPAEADGGSSSADNATLRRGAGYGTRPCHPTRSHGEGDSIRSGGAAGVRPEGRRGSAGRSSSSDDGWAAGVGCARGEACEGVAAGDIVCSPEAAALAARAGVRTDGGNGSPEHDARRWLGDGSDSDPERDGERDDATSEARRRPGGAKGGRRVASGESSDVLAEQVTALVPHVGLADGASLEGLAVGAADAQAQADMSRRLRRALGGGPGAASSAAGAGAEFDNDGRQPRAAIGRESVRGRGRERTRLRLETERGDGALKLGDDTVLLVTELAAGGELFDRLVDAGNFNEMTARHVMWQLLSALAHLHARGLVHRDVKPENILVTSPAHGPACPKAKAPASADVPLASHACSPHAFPSHASSSSSGFPALPDSAGGHAAQPCGAAALHRSAGQPAGANAAFEAPASLSPLVVTTSGDVLPTVKLADFGIARHLGSGPGAKARTFCGSPQYVAPEVLRARDYAAVAARDRHRAAGSDASPSSGSPSDGLSPGSVVGTAGGVRDAEGYGCAVDVWSAGVVVFVMLAGELPFDEGDYEAVGGAADGEAWVKRILQGQFRFDPPVWTHVSGLARDLVVRMLSVEPASRPTAVECLRHPWFLPLHAAHAARLRGATDMQAAAAAATAAMAASVPSANVLARSAAFSGAASVPPGALVGSGFRPSEALQPTAGSIASHNASELTGLERQVLQAAVRWASDWLTVPGPVAEPVSQIGSAAAAVHAVSAAAGVAARDGSVSPRGRSAHHSGRLRSGVPQAAIDLAGAASGLSITNPSAAAARGIAAPQRSAVFAAAAAAAKASGSPVFGSAASGRRLTSPAGLLFEGTAVPRASSRASAAAWAASLDAVAGPDGRVRRRHSRSSSGVPRITDSQPVMDSAAPRRGASTGSGSGSPIAAAGPWRQGADPADSAAAAAGSGPGMASSGTASDVHTRAAADASAVGGAASAGASAAAGAGGAPGAAAASLGTDAQDLDVTRPLTALAAEASDAAASARRLAANEPSRAASAASAILLASASAADAVVQRCLSAAGRSAALTSSLSAAMLDVVTAVADGDGQIAAEMLAECRAWAVTAVGEATGASDAADEVAARLREASAQTASAIAASTAGEVADDTDCVTGSAGGDAASRADRTAALADLRRNVTAWFAQRAGTDSAMPAAGAGGFSGSDRQHHAAHSMDAGVRWSNESPTPPVAASGPGLAAAGGVFSPAGQHSSSPLNGQHQQRQRTRSSSALGTQSGGSASPEAPVPAPPTRRFARPHGPPGVASESGSMQDRLSPSLSAGSPPIAPLLQRALSLDLAPPAVRLGPPAAPGRPPAPPTNGAADRQRVRGWSEDDAVQPLPPASASTGSPGNHAADPASLAAMCELRTRLDALEAALCSVATRWRAAARVCEQSLPAISRLALLARSSSPALRERARDQAGKASLFWKAAATLLTVSRAGAVRAGALGPAQPPRVAEERSSSTARPLDHSLEFD